MILNKQPVTVIGLGKSGFESAKFLLRQGANVLVTELQSNEEILTRAEALRELGIHVEIGQHSWDKILGSKLIILSPGISPSTEVYQRIQTANIPIWSEIELAGRFCPCDIIAVTGTNGKTTVSTLIGKALAVQGRHTIVCGNIGNPFVGELHNLKSDSIAVVEVSSFQLLHTQKFRPHVAVLLNITDNHLDWHGTFSNYADAKWKIFQAQTLAQYAVINADDLESMKRSHNIPSQLVYFNSGNSGNADFAAVLTVAALYRMNELKTREVLRDFKGLEHRLEEVLSDDGVRYINDSKSTSIASLRWALEREAQPVILIAGGRHKGGDFSKIQQLVSQKVKFLVAIGESARLIEKAFGDVTSVYQAKSLEDGLRCARATAKQGDTVLFSPACASFDMFLNYEDRGSKFKSLVTRLQESSVAVHS